MRLVLIFHLEFVGHTVEFFIGFFPLEFLQVLFAHVHHLVDRMPLINQFIQIRHISIIPHILNKKGIFSCLIFLTLSSRTADAVDVLRVRHAAVTVIGLAAMTEETTAETTGAMSAGMTDVMTAGMAGGIVIRYIGTVNCSTSGIQ